MQCPRCHLENPPSTESCDCGYSFVTGSYVPKASSRSGTTFSSTGAPKGRYYALESISWGCRVTAWVAAASLVVAGIVVLFNLTDQQRPQIHRSPVPAIALLPPGW
jgi:hypothetical protein